MSSHSCVNFVSKASKQLADAFINRVKFFHAQGTEVRTWNGETRMMVVVEGERFMVAKLDADGWLTFYGPPEIKAHHYRTICMRINAISKVLLPWGYEAVKHGGRYYRCLSIYDRKKSKWVGLTSEGVSFNLVVTKITGDAKPVQGKFPDRKGG